jgi:hypothetical protein
MALVNGLCPPTTETRFDINSETSCVGMLTKLFQAYVNSATSTQRVVVRFGDRWTEYNRGSQDKLLNLYMVLWNQCPAGALAGLPDLNPNKAVRRGRPARNVY